MSFHLLTNCGMLGSCDSYFTGRELETGALSSVLTEVRCGSAKDRGGTCPGTQVCFGLSYPDRGPAGSLSGQLC